MNKYYHTDFSKIGGTVNFIEGVNERGIIFVSYCKENPSDKGWVPSERQIGNNFSSSNVVLGGDIQEISKKEFMLRCL